jgi:predicted nucleic acid-binding protein
VSRFVLDASVALSWFFEDEYSPYADFVAAAVPIHHAIAPSIWPLEITNAFLTATRRGRFPEAAIPDLLENIRQLGVEIDQELAPMALADASAVIGQAYGISSYDACYLELATRRGLPLATQDQELQRAASQAGLSILKP